MIAGLTRMLRRFDVLLICLSLVVSVLLIKHFGQHEPVAVVELPPRYAEGAATASDDDAAEPYTAVRKGVPVRFMMYNVHDYFVPLDKPRSQHAQKTKPIKEREAVAEVIASVRPEIVGLVEIGGPAALRDLAERLASRGLHYPYMMTLTRWREDRALAVLSRYPIVADKSKAECVLVGQTTNRRMIRGILDVTVQVADGRCFRIMGAHLKSHVADDPRAAQAQRAREARTLAQHVQQAMMQQPEMPLLVYGDWNDGPSEPTLAVLTQEKAGGAKLKRIKPTDKNGATWTIYYKGGDSYNTFDQIYVNGILSSRMGRKAQMGIVPDGLPSGNSDHRAVWCDLY